MFKWHNEPDLLQVKPMWLQNMATVYGVNIKNLILANQYIKITKVIDNIIDIWYNVLKCTTIKNLRYDLIQGFNYD